ncbi:hypothetical protein QVD17_20560 [Tagetes erecta]|uniref:Uncharacterized protein n=1 Tax=Tagetes erecta TaxID=13708 RepID=A0AAD8KPD7_TARER|nr:hypothetical protein QVD17_20560 [Tagetes erecta]
MNGDIQSQISKNNIIVVGGTLAVKGSDSDAAANVVFRHQLFSVSTIEIMASAGLRGLIGVQASRQLSRHANATMGLAMSLRDGSINLSNSWNHSRIELILDSDSSVVVGWQNKEQKMAAAGDIRIGTSAVGAIGRYTHRFSSKSHGRITGKIGSRIQLLTARIEPEDVAKHLRDIGPKPETLGLLRMRKGRGDQVDLMMNSILFLWLLMKMESTFVIYTHRAKQYLLSIVLDCTVLQVILGNLAENVMTYMCLGANNKGGLGLSEDEISE